MCSLGEPVQPDVELRGLGRLLQRQVTQRGLVQVLAVRVERERLLEVALAGSQVSRLGVLVPLDQPLDLGLHVLGGAFPVPGAPKAQQQPEHAEDRSRDGGSEHQVLGRDLSDHGSPLLDEALRARRDLSQEVRQVAPRGSGDPVLAGAPPLRRLRRELRAN
jgi:hypothetical protein